MALSDNVKSAFKHTKDVYNALEYLEANLSGEKNLENLAEAILSLSASTSLTLSGFRESLNKGNAPAKYPVGTEIPDTYNGNDNPLIVAQYLDSTNNSSYGGAEGVILIRKYVEPTSRAYGASTSYTLAFYEYSAIASFLNTTYLDQCSDAIKSSISEISIQSRGSVGGYFAAKFFLMSGVEVYGDKVGSEGFAWDYWKIKTGLTAPSNSANTGRIAKSRDDIARNIWLRTPDSSAAYVFGVSTTGGVVSLSSRSDYGVLPACFIAKDSN